MNRLQKQIVSGVVTFSMLLTMLPTAAFAAERDVPAAETEPSLEEPLAADGLQDTGDYSPAQGETELSQQWESPEEHPQALSETEATYPVEGGNIYFDTATGTITDCDLDVKTSVVIPETIQGIAVSSSGKRAFYWCTNLTSITIPDSVTLIEDEAFSLCWNLTDVNIPSSITSIGNFAFEECYDLTNIDVDPNNLSYCSLDGVLFNKDMSVLIWCPGGKQGTCTIPASVVTLAEGAFRDCRNLSHIDVDLNNPSYCSLDGVLFNKDMSVLIQYPCGRAGTYTIPSGVSSIGDFAFYSCEELSGITIGDSVTSIGNSAFYGCNNLEIVTIPSSVTSVGDSTFYGCDRLTRATIWGSCISDSMFSYCQKLSNVTIGNGVTSIGSNAFSYCYGFENLIIPDNVSAIGDYAFFFCKGLTSIIIPDSVTSIGDSAFWYCQRLTSVDIGNSVTSIGNSAFGGCSSLAALTIPDSVTSIGGYAFGRCSNLTSVTFGNSVNFIGDEAFSHCSGLTNITIPDSVITIGFRAFDGCDGLISATIGDGVTSIGGLAFNECFSLKYVTIGNGLTNIGDSVFEFCTNLTNVTIGGTYIADHMFAGADNLTSITLGNNVTSIGDSAFSGCNSLTSVTIPDSVTSIGVRAFSDCPNLNSVTIGNGVTSIEIRAFSDCSNLNSVAIGNSVVSIESYAFYGCTSLPGLIIPNSVTSIGDYAFSDCGSITSMDIPDGVTSIGDSAFSGCGSMASVTIGDSVTSIGCYAFSGCDSITSVTIPDSVTDVKMYAFSDCSNLNSVTIGEGVISFGNYLFDGCTALNQVTIRAASIPYGMFDGFENLISVTLGDKVTTIGSNAFSDCTSLTSVTIGDGVTSIGNNAFWGCTSLTDLVLPDGVTSIGHSAFQNCTSLNSLTLPGSLISLGSDVFEGCTRLASVTIMGTYIIDNMFYDCDSLTSVTIGDNVTSIGREAFHWCSNLTSVVIGNSVTSIEYEAFVNCTNLTSIVIGNSVTSIGNSAFSFCDSLTNIYYGGSEDAWDSISIGLNNRSLTNATIHYYSTGPGTGGATGTTGTMIFMHKGLYTGQVGAVLYVWADLRAGQGDCQYLADNLQWSSTDGEIFPAGASDTWRDSLVYNSNSGEAFCMVIPRKAGQTQVTVTAPDGATSTCIVQVEDAANTVTMDDSIYLLREGDTGKVFADITAQFGLEGVEWTWSTSNSSVVAFDQQGTSTAIGSVSVIVGQPLFSTSASIDIYALGEGTATISCTLPNGVTASQEISVTGTGDSQKTVVSNDYNVPKYQDTPSNEGKARLRTYEARWQEAYRDYLDALKTALAEIQADEIDERDISVEQQAAALRQADESSKSRYLTFPANFPKEWKDLAYQAISSILLDGAKKEKLDLSDIISTDSFSTASGIVNEISRNISNVQKKFTFDSVNVEVSLGSYLGAHLGEMTFRSSSGGRSYSVVICSKQDTLNALTAEYLTQLKKLGYEAVESVYEALAEDVLGKPISKLTEPYLQKTLAKFEDFLRGKGLGVPYEVLVESYDYYTQWKKIFKSIDHYPLENAENLLKSFEIEDTSASEKVVKKALDALEKAMQKLSAATIEYLYTGTVTKEEPSLWESFKSFWGINCPVSVAIYDASGTEQLGLVGDSLETSWYNEDRIYVEEAGGAKQIYANEPITFRAVGQDYGTMSCYVEHYENGAPIGRLNFYDIALQPGTTILLPQASQAEELQSTELVVSGESVAANEFISPDTNARVTIDISVSGQGEVLGGGPYVRGDGVVLQALPEDGYQFCGWYDEDGAPVDVASIVEFTAREDRTLTALFVKEAPPTLTNYAPKLCAPYQDLCTVQVEQQQDEVTISLKWLGEEQHSLTAYLAYYNDDGQMTALTQLTAAQTADGVDFTGPVTQDVAKLLLLDEALQPVLEAYTSE